MKEKIFYFYLSFTHKHHTPPPPPPTIGNGVTENIVGGIGQILDGTDDQDTVNEGYDLLGDVQSSLLWFFFLT